MYKFFIKIFFITLLITSCKTTEENITQNTPANIVVKKTIVNQPEESTEKYVNAAVEICNKLNSKSKKVINKNIIITDFNNIDGSESIYGKLISERIINCLVNKGIWTVIERDRFNVILDEKKLEYSGLANTTNILSAGKILNAGAILTGNITRLKDHNEINARLIDIETSAIIMTVSVKEKFETGKNVNNSTGSERARKFEEEMQKLQKIKKENPDLYNQIINREEYLNKLRKGKPVEYYEFIKIIEIIRNIRLKNTGLFILTTDSTQAKIPDKIKQETPKIYNMIIKLRKAMSIIKKHDILSYNKIINERKTILKKAANNK